MPQAFEEAPGGGSLESGCPADAPAVEPVGAAAAAEAEAAEATAETKLERHSRLLRARALRTFHRAPRNERRAGRGLLRVLEEAPEAVALHLRRLPPSAREMRNWLRSQRARNHRRGAEPESESSSGGDGSGDGVSDGGAGDSDDDGSGCNTAAGADAGAGASAEAGAGDRRAHRQRLPGRPPVGRAVVVVKRLRAVSGPALLCQRLGVEMAQPGDVLCCVEGRRVLALPVVPPLRPAFGCDAATVSALLQAAGERAAVRRVGLQLTFARHVMAQGYGKAGKAGGAGKALLVSGMRRLTVRCGPGGVASLGLALHEGPQGVLQVRARTSDEARTALQAAGAARRCCPPFER